VSHPAPEVFVVDDDVAVCVALSRLIRAAGFRVQTFCAATELLESDRLKDAQCLVLDVHLPDLSGLELQKRITGLGIDLPIVFITGRGDVPMSVRAMKAGALEFLQKPFGDQELLEAIHQGIGRSQLARREAERIAGLQQRYQSLTPREREVFALVVRGLLNKQIAAELGTAERTVKIHRSQVMRKMEASSLPDLVRTAEQLSLNLPEGARRT
jgi:FixJ family two-component response regulator